ncbi:MAG: transglutaminase-like domain-containing protein, partial [Gemmatimonadaceae bacterium]
PNLAPLAVALEDRPSVGKSYVLPLFDAAALRPRDVRIDVRAESLFVVNDSSVFDTTTSRWRGVLPDTVRAWQLASQSGSGVAGWVDQQGRLLASTQFGFRLERRPYEVAFENWRRETEEGEAASRRDGELRSQTTTADRDILETTAIAANKRLRSSMAELRVHLSGVSLERGGFDLHGGRQQLIGDTLVITRENSQALSPRYIAGDESTKPDTRPEPFLEVAHPEIVALAQRLAHGSRDPRVIAQRINRWVHDSLEKAITIGIPSALHVLHTRRGDCNEHAQLFVALARAAGVPARVASGLAYVDGKFYYHAWPEVRLRTWVAVDPTFGQFPADAAHLRFVMGGFGRQMELLRLIGNLRIDVIDTR